QRKDVLLERFPSFPDDETVVGHDFITTFLPRALRRPPDARETAAYTKLFDDNHAAHNFDVALVLTMQAVIQSPSFLNRIELAAAPSKAATTTTLSAYEMASRLSYFLWSTMPDDV